MVLQSAHTKNGVRSMALAVPNSLCTSFFLVVTRADGIPRMIRRSASWLALGNCWSQFSKGFCSKPFLETRVGQPQLRSGQDLRSRSIHRPPQPPQSRSDVLVQQPLKPTRMRNLSQTILRLRRLMRSTGCLCRKANHIPVRWVNTEGHP